MGRATETYNTHTQTHIYTHLHTRTRSTSTVQHRAVWQGRRMDMHTKHTDTPNTLMREPKADARTHTQGNVEKKSSGGHTHVGAREMK